MKQIGGLFKFQIEYKQGHTSIFPYHLLLSMECTGLNGGCSVYITIYGLSVHMLQDSVASSQVQKICALLFDQPSYIVSTGRKIGTIRSDYQTVGFDVKIIILSSR